SRRRICPAMREANRSDYGRLRSWDLVRWRGGTRVRLPQNHSREWPAVLRKLCVLQPGRYPATGPYWRLQALLAFLGAAESVARMHWRGLHKLTHSSGHSQSPVGNIRSLSRYSSDRAFRSMNSPVDKADMPPGSTCNFSPTFAGRRWSVSPEALRQHRGRPPSEETQGRFVFDHTDRPRSCCR